MLKIKIHPQRTGLFTIALITVMFVLSACGAGGIVSETLSAPLSIENLLIVPFKDMSAVYGENRSVRCPLCGNIFTTGNVNQEVAAILTENLISCIKNQKDFKLIPTSQARGVLSGLLSENEKGLSEHELLVKAGSSLNADVVMVGYVYRFRERLGNRYSVDVPASVAFDIHLISVANGRIIWGGHFDETQRSLSEDLFQLGKFLKRKAAWITAEELAFSGLEKMLQTCPNP